MQIYILIHCFALIFYVYGYFGCVYLHHKHAQSSHKLKGGIGSPETGVSDTYELP